MNAESIRSYFDKHNYVIQLVRDQLSDTIQQCGMVLVEALRQGNKILIMGNGGSAADAQHFAAELVGRFLRERKGLPAIALTTDTSILTAVGNDYGFDEVFARQIEALAAPNDVVIGISTSGCSNNVRHAITLANEIGCKSVGFLGRDGGDLAKIVDIHLTVPAEETFYIQEAHVAIIHLLCGFVEQAIFPQPAILSSIYHPKRSSYESL